MGSSCGRIFLAVLVFAASRRVREEAGVTNMNDRLKVLIGATTIVAPGAQPIEDSIVVIAGPKIRAVGERKDIPVPQASDRTDLTGEWIVPADGSRIEVDEIANLLILKHAPNGIDAGGAGRYRSPDRGRRMENARRPLNIRYDTSLRHEHTAAVGQAVVFDRRP